MCRVTGLWDLRQSKNKDIENIVCRMRDTMVHGGPDDFGCYTDQRKGVALGHRRLSILDLSSHGHQPITFDGLSIVYNGEVYNFKEIRTLLETCGYSFFSQSDSEVVLKAYHKWGIECVNRFRGMWAFAVWDEKKEQLALCRDRIGVKPLYWYYNNGMFMFSSELKAFHENPAFDRTIDPDAVSLFLQYGYISAPFSIFKYAHKLEQGSFLIINKNGDIKKDRYWHVDDYYDSDAGNEFSNKSFDDVADELESILTESFNFRMVSDVPVGVFLSGGVDSSLVTALLQKDKTESLRTFTIGFEEKKYNEADWAKKVASHLGTNHTEFYCSSQEAFQVITQLPEIYDEPFGDSSSIPTYLVSKIAKRDVKVSLSADGGDEQFYGYNNYSLVSRLNNISNTPGFGMAKGLMRCVNPGFAFMLYNGMRFMLPKWNDFKDKYNKTRLLMLSKSIMEQYDIAKKFFQHDDIVRLGLHDSENHYSLVNKKLMNTITGPDSMMLLDLKTYLPDDILVKLDRATMAVALEGRDPFLDNKIIEYSSKLPMRFKSHHGEGKYILKKILYKYIPRELVDRPKKGFGAPINEWFKNDLKDLYDEFLDPVKLKNDGIFNHVEVTNLLDSYYMNKGVNPHKLWFLLVFQMWKNRWL